MNNDNPNQAPEEVTEGNFEIAPLEAITRAECDTQIATARQFPRKLSEFFRRAEAMVTSDQETAESCFYQLKRKDPREPSGYKIIEGESIRMAEIVAANFGNLRSAVHVIGHTPTRVSVRAVCHDLETNNLIAVEKQAKTTYSDGRPYSEDMSITTTNALVSKALRDAIFRVVPKALIKPLKEKAKLVAFGTGQAFLDRRKKAIAWATQTRKVPIDRVMAALGVKGEEDITIDHLALLTGLKQAIMDGDQTIEEAFPSPDEGNKPLFTHPEKQKQEASATKPVETKAPETGTTPTQSDNKAPASETKAPEAEPAPKAKKTPKAAANVVQMPPAQETKAPEKTDAQAESEMGLASEEPKLEEKPVSTGPTEAQLRLKEEMESRGYTFDELAGWIVAAKILPVAPKSWNDIPNEKAVFFLAQTKGVCAALNTRRAAAK